MFCFTSSPSCRPVFFFSPHSEELNRRKPAIFTNKPTFICPPPPSALLKERNDAVPKQKKPKKKKTKNHNYFFSDTILFPIKFNHSFLDFACGTTMMTQRARESEKERIVYILSETANERVGRRGGEKSRSVEKITSTLRVPLFSLTLFLHEKANSESPITISPFH